MCVIDNIKQFLLFFFVQFLSYAVITWNMRAVAQGRLGNVFASDMVFAFLNFKVIKKVSSAEDNWALAGYTLGGACGSIVSILITKYLYGV